MLATEAEWLKMLTCRHLISQHCNHVGSDPIRETDSRVFGNHTGYLVITLVQTLWTT